MMFEKELVKLIKEKKELAGLSDEFVSHTLSSVLFSIPLKWHSYTSFSQFRRSAACKNLVSHTRRRLREIYGLFIKKSLSSFQKRIDALCSFEDPLCREILSFHQSTNERLDHYLSVYDMIFAHLKQFNLTSSYVLLDLACGYNPFAYVYLPLRPKKYIAVDLSPSDAFIINRFFSRVGIAGEAYAFDLLSADFTSWLQKQSVDVCFLLKTLDSLELVQRNSSKKLLLALPSTLVVVSFALLSVGGKTSISSKRRVWFERFCAAQTWQYTSFQTSNELYYVIKKD